MNKEQFYSEYANLPLEKHNYHYYMHRFIDHLIEGKEAEEFFKEILK